ncbi:MAG TPA: adenosine deaminase [Longimicrobiales bacterium]|nr:adenosine deaminase [Longimicrobiales bacterium]
MLKPTDERLRRLPKAELHVHLDGSLRPATLLELATERGVALPASDEEGLARSMLVSGARNLEEYLEPFRVTLAVMQDAEAIERISFELAEDHAAENVRWLEVRFSPDLCTRQGLTSDEVVDAALAGLERAGQTTRIRTRIIVCALRSLPEAHSIEMAELAAAYVGRGVCAFDLAGAEDGYPVEDHVAAVRIAERAGLAITIHAGEGYGPDSIRQALELGHAARIGHGTRLGEDTELLRDVRESGVVLEICLTSNVQTRVAASYAGHPLRAYYDAGLRVALCTDNRLMSGVTLTQEYQHARDALAFTWDELMHVARTGFESAFAPADVRATLLEELDGGLEGVGEG